MNDETPDTALAQALATFAGVGGIALTCIALASVVALAGLVIPGIPVSISALVEAGIMSILGYASYRCFLSEGRDVPTLAGILAAPGFALLLQLELFVAALMQMIWTIAGMSAVPGMAVAGMWVLLLFALARYGTVFPAAAMGDDASLDAARRRNTTHALVWRLLAAQALLLFMISSLILLPGTAFERGFAIGSSAGLAIMTPFSVAISGFGTVLVAVILSKAYQGRY